MNILLCYWGRKGGGAQYTFEIAEEFIRQHGDRIFTSFSKDSQLFDKMDKLTRQSYHIGTFSSKLGFLFRSLFLIFKLPAIYFYIRKHKIDIVYTTMGHIWTPFLAVMLKWGNVKHVFTVHDASTHPGDKSTPLFLDKIIYKNAYKIVFLSNFVASEFGKKFPVEKKQIVLSKHGILNYRKSPSGLKDFRGQSPFRLVFFGRILFYKGLVHLLKAQRRMEEKYDDIFLEVYGSGNISIYEEDIKKIKNIKLVNRWIADNEIYEIFEKPCINIAPYVEASQSGVIPVALNCAVPTIATNIGGLPEQVEDNVTGFLVGLNNLETELCEKIEYLYQNRDVCNRFSKNCIDYVAEKLSWEKLVSNIYQDIQGENSE